MSLTDEQKLEINAAITDYTAQHLRATKLLVMHKRSIEQRNKDIEDTNSKMTDLTSKIAALQAALLS